MSETTEGSQGTETPGRTAGAGDPLPGGYPAPRTVDLGYEALDLNRAVQTYRQYYRAVSGAAIFDGITKAGGRANEVFGYFQTRPHHVGFTLNADTPYGVALLDLSAGPMVIELPPGPFVATVFDIHQHWILDMGLPGPDGGEGGRHLVLPPDHSPDPPEGFHTGVAASDRVIAAIRVIPAGADVAAALERLTTVKVYPLDPGPDWSDPAWFEMTAQGQDTTPLAYETGLEYWRALHALIDSEPGLPEYRSACGDLAALGIVRGRPFAPDERMTRILELAAKTANTQMRVESLADRSPEREVWPDRQWEWAALRHENGTFDAEGYRDTHAIDKWFFQAIAVSPAMFRRDPGAGSLYWLGSREQGGDYLCGENGYRLTVPLPVPATLFWSVTVYDAETRSQIRTAQDRAALRSEFELADLDGDSVDLFFGPEPPESGADRWIQTTPGQGWFAYLRLYGPEGPAFDGSWKPGDFVAL
ncbi:DUF1214 domain-containing protein [Mycolicibacterium palauense]|uniref:DUF1214 domain-containing protein n=1 Tax=Mycolicibacterium palauense TaxID=2034511 RepID=UPI000BFEBE6D|nr:DUF1214 domain-containing protein [Mycolicibacterium palauense]